MERLLWKGVPISIHQTHMKGRIRDQLGKNNRSVRAAISLPKNRCAYPDLCPAASLAPGSCFLCRGFSGERNSLSPHTVDFVVVGGEPSVVSEESLLTFKRRIGPRVVSEGFASIARPRYGKLSTSNSIRAKFRSSTALSRPQRSCWAATDPAATAWK